MDDPRDLTGLAKQELKEEPPGLPPSELRPSAYTDSEGSSDDPHAPKSGTRGYGRTRKSMNWDVRARGEPFVWGFRGSAGHRRDHDRRFPRTHRL